MIHNGRDVVRIQTWHGSFGFTHIRFRDGSGHEVRLEDHAFAQRVSDPLRTLALGWVNALSFSKVSLLIEQVSGHDLLSEDNLGRMVQVQAGRLDSDQAQQIAENACLPEPTYVAPDRVVALTDGAKSIRADLFALFGEGIQVILD